jgi:hypothetical protein
MPNPRIPGFTAEASVKKVHNVYSSGGFHAAARAGVAVPLPVGTRGHGVAPSITYPFPPPDLSMCHSLCDEDGYCSNTICCNSSGCQDRGPIHEA